MTAPLDAKGQARHHQPDQDPTDQPKGQLPTQKQVAILSYVPEREEASGNYYGRGTSP